MDAGELQILQEEAAADEANRDTPPNRTARDLMEQLTRLQDALDALDDIDDLGAPACELAEHVRREVVDLLHAAVRFDRARDVTWEQIGASLHVTRQAAWERFGP